MASASSDRAERMSTTAPIVAGAAGRRRVHARGTATGQDGAVTTTAPRETEGFGDVAREALATAEDEARALGHGTLGTEHLLLGILATDGSGAAGALRDAGVTLAAARHKVVEAVGRGAAVAAQPTEPLPATSRAGRALGRAVRFSHLARAEAVATGHVLLGVLDVEGQAGQVLRGLGVDVHGLRGVLADVEDDAAPPPRPATAAPAPDPEAAPGPEPEPAPGRRPETGGGLAPAPPGAARKPQGDRGAPGRRPAAPERRPVQPAPQVPVAEQRPAAPRSPEHRPPPRSAPAATCPSCRAELVQGLAYQVVKARSEGLRTRDALLYSCASCGTALGVAPA
jgi:ATP-dependent Clp protease ATP-binding subunit ClpC